jgi:hypothetical protein
MSTKDRFIGKMIDGHYHQTVEAEQGFTRDQLIAGKTGEQYGKIYDLIMKGVGELNGNGGNGGNGPEPVDPLPEAYRVDTLVETQGRPILLAPVFIPDMLISTRIQYEDIERDLLPKMTSGDHGNALRFFLAGVWERYTLRETRFPYHRLANGKFDLPDPNKPTTQTPEKVNDEWLAEVIRRVKLFASHCIFVGIDLIDNCSLHNKVSHWGLHWMNPANCNQPTHPHPSAMYHYYEYWPGGTEAGDVTHQESMMYKTTGVIVEALYEYVAAKIWENLTPAERPYVGFNAGNEVMAGFFWHVRMDNIINNACPGMKKYQRFTSMGQNDEFHLYRKQTHKIFNYAVHGIGSIENYAAAAAKVPAAFQPSCDGFMWIEPEQAYVNTKHFLADGSFGYELLEGLWDQYATLTGKKNYDLTLIDWEPGLWATGALKEYIGA